MSDRPPSGSSGQDDHAAGERPVDRSTLRSVLERHPVRLAVLFGSYATGAADARSDVDVLVELDPGTDRRTVAMDLLRDLSVELDRNDVDLSLVDDVDPRVGLAAFEHGDLVLGTADRVEQLRGRFEGSVEPPSREELRDRFDDVLEAVDAAIERGT